MPACNSTLSDERIHDEAYLFGHIDFHHIGLIISAVFGLISIVISFFLIFQHATHYLKPWEQKHIIRILFMVPVYAAVSFLSFLYYWHAVYYDVLEQCYEPFAIAAFFTLMCVYIAPTLRDQKDYFRSLQPRNWVLGVFGLQYITGGQNKGPFRKPRSGLTWFNVIWTGIFQYCFIRVLFTIVAVLAQAGDVYCVDSLSPAFAHLWCEVFTALSVTVAMYCLVQFYVQLRGDLAEHKPGLKVLCIKLVIFFSFWQSIIFSFGTSSHFGVGPAFKTNKYISYPDIRIGVPSMMLDIEMAIFAVLHLFAFPWKPYSIQHSYNNPINEPGSGYSGDMKYKGGPLGLYAIADAFNPWDIIKQTARGFRWLFVGYKSRQQDASYQTPTKVNNDTRYAGPTYAGSGEPATELRSNDERRRRTDTLATLSPEHEDDRAGLLRNSGIMGHSRPSSTSPYRTATDAAAADIGFSAPRRIDTNDEYTSGDDQMDLGAPHRRNKSSLSAAAAAEGLDMKPADFDNDDTDTAYHPGFLPPGSNAAAAAGGSGGGVHPALRGPGQSSAQAWNDDAQSLAGRPPPSYRTDDPYR